MYSLHAATSASATPRPSSKRRRTSPAWGERDRTSVKKTAGALLKLLYPHRTLETIREHELAPCLDLANECRSRVLEQLATMLPGEFANRRIAAAVAQ